MPQHTFQIDTNTIAFYSLQDNDHNLHLTEHLLKMPEIEKKQRHDRYSYRLKWTSYLSLYQMCTHEFVNATQVQIT